MSGGVLDREGEEQTDDVDRYTFPRGAIVLVLKVQVLVIAGQFHLRCDPTEAPGGVSPVKGRSE